MTWTARMYFNKVLLNKWYEMKNDDIETQIPPWVRHFFLDMRCATNRHLLPRIWGWSIMQHSRMFYHKNDMMLCDESSTFHCHCFQNDLIVYVLTRFDQKYIDIYCHLYFLSIHFRKNLEPSVMEGRYPYILRSHHYGIWWHMICFYI